MFGFKKKKKHKDSMPLESILALNYSPKTGLSKIVPPCYLCKVVAKCDILTSRDVQELDTHLKRSERNVHPTQPME